MDGVRFAAGSTVWIAALIVLFRVMDEATERRFILPLCVIDDILAAMSGVEG